MKKPTFVTDVSKMPKIRPWWGYRRNSNEERTATMLVYHQSFTDDLELIRKEIGLSKLLVYPDELKPPKSEVNAVVSLLEDLGSDKRQTLESRVNEIMAKYKLVTPNWDLPLQIAVLTNVLLIHPEEGISVHIPENLREKPKDTNSLAMSVVRQRQLLERANYPAIYFTRYTSPTELIGWIRGNSLIFSAIQSKLPREKRVGTNQNTMFWGWAAWLMGATATGRTSWTDIVNRLEKFELIRGEEADTDDIPNPSQLQLHYKRFLEASSSFQSP